MSRVDRTVARRQEQVHAVPSDAAAARRDVRQASMVTNFGKPTSTMRMRQHWWRSRFANLVEKRS